MFFTIPEKCACSSGYSEYMLKEKRFKHVANCDKTNQQEPAFHCFNRFMDSESSCDIPWLKEVKSIFFHLNSKTLIKLLSNVNFFLGKNKKLEGSTINLLTDKANYVHWGPKCLAREACL